MKRLFIIFLIGALIINTVGYYLISEASLYQIKSQSFLNIAKGIKTDLSVQFRIPVNASNKDLDVNNNELTYKGQLFDIAKVQISGNWVTYTCIPDTSEDQLIQGRNNWAADQAGHSTNKKILSIYKSIQLYFIDTQHQQQPTCNLASSYRAFHLKQLSLLDHPIIIPPPEEV